MRLSFDSLDDRIAWHVMREVSSAPKGIAIPWLIQTLSDFGPADVRRVIDELRGNAVIDQRITPES
jgi:hypothetical protein